MYAPTLATIAAATTLQIVAVAQEGQDQWIDVDESTGDSTSEPTVVRAPTANNSTAVPETTAPTPSSTDPVDDGNNNSADETSPFLLYGLPSILGVGVLGAIAALVVKKRSAAAATSPKDSPNGGGDGGNDLEEMVQREEAEQQYQQQQYNDAPPAPPLLTMDGGVGYEQMQPDPYAMQMQPEPHAVPTEQVDLEAAVAAEEEAIALTVI